MRYRVSLPSKFLFLVILFVSNACSAEVSAPVEDLSLQSEKGLAKEELPSNDVLSEGDVSLAMPVESVTEQRGIYVQNEIQKLKNDKLLLEMQLVSIKNKEQQTKIDSLTRELNVLDEQLRSDKKGMGFEVWLGLTLASVTLIVTGLGVIIALLAFFGYSNIKKAATQAAVKKSESLVLKAIKDGQFNQVIYSAVERAVYRGILSEEDFPEEEELSS